MDWGLAVLPSKILAGAKLEMDSQMPYGNNGRVNLFGPSSAGGTGDALGPIVSNGNNAGAFPGFGYQDKSEKQFQGDMLRGNWEQNDLSRTFFSQTNLAVIQNAIRRSVFERSQPKGYVIDDQSVDELKMIMRAMFYQYARNLPYDIQGQIEDLNARVVEWSVPHILSAVDHYVWYLKDVDTLPTPLSHPVHLSPAGTRSKPLAPFM